DVEPLRVRRHQSVFDAVVDHLREVACPARATVQVPMLGGPARPVAPRSPRERPGSRRERGEDGIEPAYHLGLAAEHEAVSPIEAEDPTAGTAVNVVQPPVGQPMGEENIYAVIRIAAVDYQL